MKFENSTYQQPLSMIGLGGGATSLSRGGAAGQNYWPFDTDKIIMPTKSPVYTFGEKTARTSLLPTTGFYMKPDGTAMFTMQIDNKIRRIRPIAEYHEARWSSFIDTCASNTSVQKKF